MLVLSVSFGNALAPAGLSEIAKPRQGGRQSVLTDEAIRTIVKKKLAEKQEY
jgi:hypothetical protein